MMPISERPRSHLETYAAVRALLESTQVTDLMVSPVRCAQAAMSCAEVAQLMTEHEISAMPVVDDEGKVQGIITKTDVVRCGQGAAADRDAAGEVLGHMTPFVLRLRAGDTLNNAVHLMTNAGVHHLVVVDEGNRPQGILSSLDLLHFLAGISESAALDEEVGIHVEV